MQSSMWKLLTAVGIIGIGTLVVLEVQSRLPTPSRASVGANAAATAPAPVDTDVIPDAATDLDKMLSGAETFDDTQFALNEPDAVNHASVPVVSSEDHREISVAPVSRTVLKDKLTDDENPFDRSFVSGSQPEPANTATAAVPQTQSALTIQPASFAGDSVPVTATTAPKTTKQTSSSGTIFFNGNSNQDGVAAADSPTDKSKSIGSIVEKQMAETITTAAQSFSESRTTATRSAAVPTVQIESDTPDLFMPDLEPEIDRPESPAAPRRIPADDAPLMDSPGFEADSPPNFDFTPEPEPVTPNTPDRQPVPADRPAGDPARLPAPPASDGNTRFFEADVPLPAPPADNAGSRPETRPVPPSDFDLEPVPGLDDRRTDPRSTPDPGLRSTPRNPLNDGFPAPSYPDRNSGPDLDDNSPFGLSPDRRNEFNDSLELPAISDRPVGSAPDRSRGNLREPADRTMSQIMRPQLSIQKKAPDRATVGVPHEYTILVSNEGDSPAYDVIVDDDLGDGARLEYSKPTADFDRNSGKLNWTIATLAPRAKQEILVRITPTGEGTLDGIATVRFKAQVKSATIITAPKVTLEITGPAEVKVGDEVQLRYVVRNNGTGDASNVILRSVLPPGLRHSEGGDLEYEIDNLRAGDREEIDLTVVAAEPGSLRMDSEVTMSGVSADQASTRIDIVGSQLMIQRLGPERRFVGRTASFQNIISNETNFEANNATVTEQVPEGMRFISADNGGVYNPQTGRIRWEIGRLLPHKQTVLGVELEAESAGQRQTIVEVVESAGFKSQATENTVVTVEDYDNMTADISRQDAPVAIGETFGFTITIENRGTAVAHNVEMVVNVPPEISVKAAGTRTNPARRVGNSVHYALVEAIQPAEKMTFELKLQGAQAAQNALVRASLRYEHLKEPLIVTESVTIFEDRP